MTFMPLDSLLSPTMDGVNVIINFLFIKKLLRKTTIVRNYCLVQDTTMVTCLAYLYPSRA